MKDPFSMQPVPKSFYHPSQTKDVDEREAIKSPVRKNHLASQCAIEEQFLRGSPTYKTSALPRFKTVNNYDRPATEQRKSADEVIGSGHFDETWPDSERPTIDSVSQNISNITSVTEQAAPTTHPLTSITDIVTGLEKLKFQPREPAKETREKDGNDGDVSKGQNGSVLQRYVERFRNAAPMSREERMRESEKKKQEFWWLHSPADSTTNTTTEEEKQTKSRQLHSDTKAKPESQGRVKLTKEALTAMDEETEKLQNKADLLLSRSELSLASSGPIVSTDGLGTSTSVSDYSSVTDEQAPYRPTFARLHGLLRSGAWKEEDRPLWYDVVKALPPKPVPPVKQVPNILYPEDFVRVRFYQTFVEPGACVLSNERMKSIPQRFVDKYLELHAQKTLPNEQLFDETVHILKEEGVKLITHEEKQASDRARIPKQQQTVREFSDDKPSPSQDPGVVPTTTKREIQRPKVDLDNLFQDKT